MPWQTYTTKAGMVKLKIQDDGNFVVVKNDGTVLWWTNPVNRGSSLASGDVLFQNQYLQSSDGKYILKLTQIANLVLYSASDPNTKLWESNTKFAAGGFLAIQGDGNAVIYSKATETSPVQIFGMTMNVGTTQSTPLWSSKTSYYGKNVTLLFRADGNVVVAKSVDKTPLWWALPLYLGSSVPSSYEILPNSYLSSPNGKVKAIFQSDSNFVIYYDDDVLWASNTNGDGAKNVFVQADGNVVMYGTDNSVLWATNTNINAGVTLLCSDDGNLQVIQKSNGKVLWSAQPVGVATTLYSGGKFLPNQALFSSNARFRFAIQNDGTLALFRDGVNKLWSLAPKALIGMLSTNLGDPSINSAFDFFPTITPLYLMVNSDGNVAYYIKYKTYSGPAFTTSTSGKGNVSLTLQDDGNVVVRQVSTGAKIYSLFPNYLGFSLDAGSVLKTNQYLLSSNFQFKALLQGDSNFVVLDQNNQNNLIWKSDTQGKGGIQVGVAVDGNVALTTSGNVTVWQTSTSKYGLCSLELSDDGNLQLVQTVSDMVVWGALELTC